MDPSCSTSTSPTVLYYDIIHDLRRFLSTGGHLFGVFSLTPSRRIFKVIVTSFSGVRYRSIPIYGYSIHFTFPSAVGCPLVFFYWRRVSNFSTLLLSPFAQENLDQFHPSFEVGPLPWYDLWYTVFLSYPLVFFFWCQGANFFEIFDTVSSLSVGRHGSWSSL